MPLQHQRQLRQGITLLHRFPRAFRQRPLLPCRILAGSKVPHRAVKKQTAPPRGDSRQPFQQRFHRRPRQIIHHSQQGGQGTLFRGKGRHLQQGLFPIFGQVNPHPVHIPRCSDPHLPQALFLFRQHCRCVHPVEAHPLHLRCLTAGQALQSCPQQQYLLQPHGQFPTQLLLPPGRPRQHHRSQFLVHNTPQRFLLCPGIPRQEPLPPCRHLRRDLPKPPHPQQLYRQRVIANFPTFRCMVRPHEGRNLRRHAHVLIHILALLFAFHFFCRAPPAGAPVLHSC